MHAQVGTPPLERTVSVELEQISTKEALKMLEAAGEFSFAYRTDIISQTDQLARNYNEQTVREILDDLFQGSKVYKEKGNYVILRDAPKVSNQEVNIDGYIINALTGEKVAFASVYDTLTLASAVSDAYGHYAIKVSTKNHINLTVRKDGFKDTTVRWTGEGSNVLNVKIYPEVSISEIDSLSPEDSIRGVFDKLKDMKFFNPSDEQKANLINFKDKLKRKVQFSVIPGVGTNGRLSSVTKVDYSINLFGGFNGGVRVAEVGGLFNIDWDSVSYFQAAGMFNIVGGPQKGAQLAGFANFNDNSFNGGQFAGFMNIVRKDMHGGQFAGFANFMGDSSSATQVAGFGNFAGRNDKGAQLAGFGNWAGRNYSGAQVAGFGNFIGNDAKGIQLAGFINAAGKNYEGTQISGFINVAENIKGAQLGFVNINDSIDGVPIGFFSFSRKGLHQLELSANEVFPVNVAFKTGTNQFYNTFSVGTSFDNAASPTWNFGYGIGSSVRVTARSRVFFDLQTQSLQRGATNLSGSSLSKFTASYHFNLWKKVAIAAGPSFNMLIVNNSDPLASEFSNLAPYNFFEGLVANNTNAKMWVGGHLALRFF